MRGKIVFVILSLLLTGCVARDFQKEMSDVIQSTTTKDTVEAEPANDDSSPLNIIETLRSRNDPQKGDPNWSPVEAQKPLEPYVAATGSLFDIDEARDLYNDIKPRKLGDLVTVLLDENTQAQKNASNDTNKSSNLNLDPVEFGGQEIKLGESNLSFALSNDNQTSGSTSANQSNSISGSITVEVIEVKHNGNLVVRGEKWLRINTGDEFIRLSGTIRPQDIEQDNTIASTRISNVIIQYSATGSRQDVQEQNWLARFFNVIL